MLPRGQKAARTKRKVEGRKRIANGTAGQTRAFLRPTPVGSMGFGELLVRTSERETVRKNRGRSAETPTRKGFTQKQLECTMVRPAKRFRMQKAHPAKPSGAQRTRFEGCGGSARIRSLVLRHSAQK